MEYDVCHFELVEKSRVLTIDTIQHQHARFLDKLEMTFCYLPPPCNTTCLMFLRS